MREMTERGPIKVGVIGTLVTATLVVGVLNYNKLPFINGTHDYSAYFGDAAGLRPDSAVEVAGLRVGKVSSIDLDGDQVLVKFHIDGDVQVGDRSEAAIKTKTVLGAKFVEVTPRGGGHQSIPIPIGRTTSPYQLADALGDLSTTVNGLNTNELSASLATLAQTFSETPPDVRAAVQGASRFADTIAQRDEQVRSLLSHASKVSRVLSERSDQIVNLVGDTNALLAALRSQSNALDTIAGNISAVSRQVHDFVAENRQTFKPALDKLNGVLKILEHRKASLQDAIKRLNTYSMTLGESISSGPFFKGYVSNILPGQFLQPFIDAAFSDLGLDPNVLAPSQLVDPQVGQPGTPGLPMPYPRTGQGGPPSMHLPDAITGNPGDLPCGPIGLVLPGPGCYPYREPLPAPAPGGPPPGPPADVRQAPTTPPVYVNDPLQRPADSSPPGSPAPAGGHQ
ncbi:MCE family protein [Mycobacterium sp. 050128]|uniref:MCE family protein n=1 Tax=Mycobacterium sp. 050128 TaxID=3096112 RepID=UPI002EDB2B63